MSKVTQAVIEGMSQAIIATGVRDVSLPEVESAANDAYRTYYEATEASAAAKEKATGAEQAYIEAMNQYMYGDGSQESFEKMQKAKQELETAQEEETAAEAAQEAAMAEAQAAAEAVEEKKEELRQSRHLDTAYVVHCARVECTYGMRESYLALGQTHGVKTRQIPQMTSHDTILDTNIINFGGCRSKENPTLRAAAEEAARKANEEIEEKKGFIDGVIDFFCGNREIEVTDSLMEQCMGECKACFPVDAQWRSGHKKAFINGEAVLLRRCSVRCSYGGEVTILLSGQPE